MRTGTRVLLSAVLLLFIAAFAMGQNTNLLPNGGFESGKPSLWNPEPGGATLTWATDQTYNGSPHSLKIVKTGTGTVSRWFSTNMVRYWVDNIGRNVDIKLGAYVKTSGVNINPANDAARWQLKFWFYDTLGALIGGQPFALNFDQTVATRDWYADTNGVGTVNLPVNAYRMRVSVEGGVNATGTVWADNFIHVGRAGQWAGQNWNGLVEADSGWQYWQAPDGGNDGRTYFPGSGVTTEQARTGTSSLKITAPVGRPSGELVWFTETVPVPANSAGKQYVLSAWVKTGSIKKDSVFNASYALGFTWTWHTKLFADAGGWNEFGSGEYRFVLKDTSSNWTQYQVIITVPDNSVRAVSVRPRAYPLWTGVAYYDDFELSPLNPTNIVQSVAGFESGKPSLWQPEAGGATLTWATDQTYNGSPHSLKIVKTGTGTVSRWLSTNMVRYWVDNIPRNVDIKLGAYVKTSGVNTAPANDAARWQLKFWFYDTLGALIGGQPFALNFDQTIATRDWYADTNGVGTVNLPVNAYRMLVSVEGGPNATGTVWADNFIHVGRAGAWAGQNWNGFVEADSGWQYWQAPDGGNDGRTYFPGSGVTTEQARTGTSSLKIIAPVGRPSGELVWFTETVPVLPNSAGKKYVFSAWMKTGSIKKDSVFNSSYALGFTWTWHTKLFADAGGWNEFGSGEYRFVLKDTSSNWTQYQVIITVPDNAVRAVSVRPRAYPLWTGVAYYDDFSVNGVDFVTSVDEDGPKPISSTIPSDYKLEQNYPNPFNPSTTINYDLTKSSAVRLDIYNIIGQKVRTLINDVQSAGSWKVVWNGNDDFGVSVASGVYFYRLATPNVVLTRKMVLMK